jgi:hypothetical protein
MSIVLGRFYRKPGSMERFLKRKSPPSATYQDEGSSQRNKGASNISAPTRTSLILSPKDVNLDELPL